MIDGTKTVLQQITTTRYFFSKKRIDIDITGGRLEIFLR